ncbi:hypothetical protein, partial [Klebsiella aerogenes]|uniref:hypothetical protein n=1 Tax=Klebsiella aerogenes TaxID=548 RepID=UPI001CC032E0
YMCMFDDNWDYTEVRDFDKLRAIYDRSDIFNTDYGDTLCNRLGLNIVYLSDEQSIWYKTHMTPYNNLDIMLPERDYNKVINDTAR